MKINYKVLWIEDNFDEVKNFAEGLRIRLKNYGFNFDIDSRISISTDEINALSKKLSVYNPYDMIFFDYDLGDNMTGDEIASKLRKTIYTDMIFYSGKSGVELRKALYEKKVDGVYIVHRPDFVDDTWPIIEDQIKRICDINNMRGVLLDEMSKIDLFIRGLYKNKYDNLPDTIKEEQLTRFKKKCKNRKKSIEKKLSSINTGIFSGMIMNHDQLDFNAIRSRLNSIYENNELFGENGKLKINQDLRNKFAHNMAKYNDEDGTVSLEGYDETYNFDNFTKIRKVLLDLVDDLENIDKNN